MKRTNTTTGAWTVYIGGIYEVTNTAALTKYYTALGRTIAMRQSGTPYWLLSDHVGSNSVITRLRRTPVVGSVKYGPYGGTLVTASRTSSYPRHPHKGYAYPFRVQVETGVEVTKE